MFIPREAVRRFLWAAQLKFDLNSDKRLRDCKLCATSLQPMFKLCVISENCVCTFRVALIAKTDMPSPVYYESVHKTSSLYKCT